MNLKVKDKGIITFRDNTTSKVILVEIEKYSSMPNDYWFEYEEQETNRPLIHPDIKKPHIKSSILLPEGMVSMVFKKTLSNEEEELNKESFEYKFEKYLKEKFNKEDHEEARNLFKRLRKLKSEEEIIKEYFN